MPQHVVEEFHAKVEVLEQIKEVEYEERAEKHLQRAEMEATKAENLVEHARDIHARPAKTWFQSEREKKAQSKASLKASEREDVDELEDVALGNGAGKKGKKTRRAERGGGGAGLSSPTANARDARSQSRRFARRSAG